MSATRALAVGRRIRENPDLHSANVVRLARLLALRQLLHNLLKHLGRVVLTTTRSFAAFAGERHFVGNQRKMHEAARHRIKLAHIQNFTRVTIGHRHFPLILPARSSGLVRLTFSDAALVGM